MLRPATWLLAAVALAGAGCASLSEHRNRGKLLRAEMVAFRYQQPQELVWSQVQLLLAERGLTLAGPDAKAAGQKPGGLPQVTSAAKATHSTPSGGLLLETAWNEQGFRWRAEAEPDAGGLRVVLTRIELNRIEFGMDGVTLRDHDLELDLLRRVDPEAAARIEDLIDQGPPAGGKKG
jgi:hypothetical protein